MGEKKEESLQSAINSKGYNWQAAKTSVSELSIGEQKARLGLLVDKAELEATAKAIEAATNLKAFEAAIALPSAVDWRNKGGDWTTPIKDQGSCGSCVAFGTVATVESRIDIVCKNPNLDKDLSEAHLLFCGGGSCSGWNFTPALDYCKNNGVALESVFPYKPMNQPCPSPSPSPIYIKITGWTKVLTIADRKNILATKGPMVAGMAVYQDFFSYKSGVYKHVSGGLAGYHCIMVAGYDDNQRCWICKNSWGTGWGENGWFKLGYGECLIDTEFAFYDIDLEKCPEPQLQCERHIPYLRKVLAAARVNVRLKAALCYYICRKGKPPHLMPADVLIIRRVIAILKECPKYRIPFCRVLNCSD